LAHPSKDEREAVFTQLVAGAAAQVAAGVQFAEELLAYLLAALPRNDRGAPVLHNADSRLAALPSLHVDAATLVNARFDRTSLQGGGAGFGDASVLGIARFDRRAEGLRPGQPRTCALQTPGQR
jgi:hypothetical protein